MLAGLARQGLELARTQIDLQLVSDVMVERRRVAGGDAVAGGIVVEGLARVIQILAGVAAVEAANGEALIAAVLLHEAEGVDAQAGLVEILLGEAGQLGQGLADAGLLGVGDAVALEEGRRILVDRELAGALDVLLDGHALLAQPGVVPMGGGVGRQEADVRHFVAGLEAGGREVEHGRDQHDAVQAVAVEAAFQHLGQLGGAGGAIAFTRQILGRVPALVLGGPLTDELGDALGILIDPPVILAFALADGAAEAGADGVDEHHVGNVERALFVVDDLVGRGAIVLGVRRQNKALRAERAHVQPQRRGAGAAVEDEDDRAGGGVLHALADVAGGENGRAGLVVLIVEIGLACDGLVAHFLPVEAAGVLGGEHFWLGDGILCRLFRFGRCLVGGNRRSGRRQNGKGQKRGAVFHMQNPQFPRRATVPET